ncbi:MAG: flagellar biosynthetic protein FliO [candidate division KSB1 bacterium]|nr:flagellar biosynthetic protein FliO [candidate division KSB1 bacterium]MDZ7338301.1 flagellar biosynthetic protein FliO [candidate division KSB1 bacterium]MDZ7386522.1 flagellar biosynthetic protein FliO [candidate division KSB1 bacterium]MDZ7393387.1 flagellar biosynthetic protein FliO [candidate division KSB1 bacterium]MDZ7414469.1 flagellar biosynthetic protein FliO [candidate division KSB1 bacterium]
MIRQQWRRHRRALLAVAGLVAMTALAVVAFDVFPSSGAPSQTGAGGVGLRTSEPGAGTLLMRMFLALAAVVALIWAGAYFLRRYSGRGGNGMQTAQLRVVGWTLLGPKRALYAVLAADRVLILGVTDSQITLLSEIQEPERVAAFASSSKESGGHSFAAYLNGLLKGGGVHAS